jgi:hypothetical protein
VTHTRPRTVPVTLDGETYLVTEQVPVPAPPRDWDHAIRIAATAATALILAASVTWTTASAGGLLAAAVPQPVAYGAAVAFDVSWMICTAFEWLGRHDPRRATIARRVGWAALAVAVGAVAVHGCLAASWGVAAVGAAVSVLAKAVWAVALHHHAPPLDDLTRAALRKRRAQLGAELAVAADNREITRARGQLAALRASLAPDTADSDPDSPDDRVRDALSALPEPDRAAVADYLAQRATDTPPDNEDTSSTALLRPVPATVGRTPDTITDTVRTALASGVRDPDSVLSVARQVHGQHVTRATVTRLLRRLGGGSSAAS